jgi:hypothetical protein
MLRHAPEDAVFLDDITQFQRAVCSRRIAPIPDAIRLTAQDQVSDPTFRLVRALLVDAPCLAPVNGYPERARANRDAEEGAKTPVHGSRDAATFSDERAQRADVAPHSGLCRAEGISTTLNRGQACLRC